MNNKNGEKQRKKHFLNFAVTLVGIAIIIVIFFCFKDFYDSMQPIGGREIISLGKLGKYKKYLRQEYITNIDLVVHSSNYAYDEYLLSKPGGGQMFPTLDEIKKFPFLPYDYDQFHRIHGVLPSGSTFKIIDVFKVRLIKVGNVHDSTPRLKGKIISEGPLFGYEVQLHELTNLIYGRNENEKPDTLKILEEFAVPVKPDNEKNQGVKRK